MNIYIYLYIFIYIYIYSSRSKGLLSSHFPRLPRMNFPPSFHRAARRDSKTSHRARRSRVLSGLVCLCVCVCVCVAGGDRSVWQWPRGRAQGRFHGLYWLVVVVVVVVVVGQGLIAVCTHLWETKHRSYQNRRHRFHSILQIHIICTY